MFSLTTGMIYIITGQKRSYIKPTISPKNYLQKIRVNQKFKENNENYFVKQI